MLHPQLVLLQLEQLELLQQLEQVVLHDVQLEQLVLELVLPAISCSKSYISSISNVSVSS